MIYSLYLRKLELMVQALWNKFTAPLKEMDLGMTPDDVQESGLRSAIAGFRARCAAAGRDEALWLPAWRDEDWNSLFGFMDIRKVDRKSTRLNSSHRSLSRMPSSA